MLKFVGLPGHYYIAGTMLLVVQIGEVVRPIGLDHIAESKPVHVISPCVVSNFQDMNRSIETVPILEYDYLAQARSANARREI